MTQEAAERFAQALLMQFGKEREFKFELPEGHNMEFVMNRRPDNHAVDQFHAAIEEYILTGQRPANLGWTEIQQSDLPRLDPRW